MSLLAVVVGGQQAGEFEAAQLAALLLLVLGPQGGQEIQRRFGFGRCQRLGGQALDGQVASGGFA